MGLSSLVDLEKTSARVEKQLEGKAIHWPGLLFQGFLLATLVFTLLVLVVLMADVVSDGWSVLSTRFGDFVTSPSRTRSGEAGIFQGLRGTFWIGIFVVLLAFPVGVASAIYLEEYATDNWFARFVNLNIRNLAGVPSVVYGILGFSIFVKFADGFFPNSSADHFGKTTAAGGVTLAVLALPIVIITASEAIRAVPDSLREAGYGVGATKWEVVRSHVLPYAAPGILTGTLLSLARALGEAAPLILVGAIRGRLGSRSGFFELGQLGEKFTAMPIVITEYATKPGKGWPAVAAAGIVVLMMVVLMANATAILLRNYFEKKREGR